MSHRRLAALRALAERPGTEGEGVVARKKLAELEAKLAERDPYEAFAAYLRSGSMEDLNEACRRAREEKPADPPISDLALALDIAEKAFRNLCEALQLQKATPKEKS